MFLCLGTERIANSFKNGDSDILVVWMDFLLHDEFGLNSMIGNSSLTLFLLLLSDGK